MTNKCITKVAIENPDDFNWIAYTNRGELNVYGVEKNKNFPVDINEYYGRISVSALCEIQDIKKNEAIKKLKRNCILIFLAYSIPILIIVLYLWNYC